MDSEPTVKTTPSGLEHTNVIDVIAHDAKTDVVTLVMRESRDWDGSEKQVFQLQEKINAYLSFALDGEMIEAYPAFVGKEIRLMLQGLLADRFALKFYRETRTMQGYVLSVDKNGPKLPPLRRMCRRKARA